ncbi:MAG: polyhydroxyalkanoate synthesis repressor PhaR [Steroidobacteraceae bacterium]
MSEPRVIKKYPNRRLYDTVESRYITLEDIRKLVVDQIEFVVVDKLTQDDITNGILLQVIAELEHGGDPMMSRDFLAQLIRCYGGGAMQHLTGCYLEQSLKLFANQRRELRERTKSLIGVDPHDAAAAVVPKNFQRWRSAQDEIFRTLLDTSTRTLGTD